MASCRVIRNMALRKLGVLGAGREPRASDGQDAFDALQGLYRTMINAGAFGRLCDVVPTGTDYTARRSERIFRQNDATLSITLPELVSGDPGCCQNYGTVVTIETDGPTVTVIVQPSQPIGRVTPPHDCMVVVISDGFTGITSDFIYDGHVKKWQSIYDLMIDAEAPLSFRDVNGLSSLLATTIADQFGGQLTDPTVSAARIFQSSLTQRFSMPARISPGVYF